MQIKRGLKAILWVWLCLALVLVVSYTTHVDPGSRWFLGLLVLVLSAQAFVAAQS